MNKHSANRKPAPISVVIPAHNAGDFLMEAIESIRVQTLPVNEIIVVDDGSTDGSCSRVVAADVRLIRQKRSGPSTARNVGIRVALNPWIAFLDADDQWQPDKIERQWSLICSFRNIGIVSCDHSTVRSGNVIEASYLNRLADFRMYAKVLKQDPDALCFGRIGKWFFDCRWVILPSTVLVHRQTIWRAGLFDERLQGCEDYECFMRVLTTTKFGVINRVLMQYRLHERNLHENTDLMQINYKKMWESVTVNSKKYSPFLIPALQWIPDLTLLRLLVSCAVPGA